MCGTVGPGGTNTLCCFRVKFIGRISLCYFVAFISSRLTRYFLLPLFGNVLQTYKKVTIHGLAGGRLILTEEEFLDEVTSKAKYCGEGGGRRQHLCEGRRERLCQLASKTRRIIFVLRADTSSSG